MVHDLRAQAARAAEALGDAAEPLLGRDDPRRFAGLLRRFTAPGRRVALLDELGQVVAASADLRSSTMTLIPLVSQALRERTIAATAHTLAGWPTWVHIAPLGSGDVPRGVVAVVLDATELDAVAWNLGRQTMVRITALVLALTGILWLVLRWSVTAPVVGTTSRSSADGTARRYSRSRSASPSTRPPTPTRRARSGSPHRSSASGWNASTTPRGFPSDSWRSAGSSSAGRSTGSG